MNVRGWCLVVLLVVAASHSGEGLGKEVKERKRIKRLFEEDGPQVRVESTVEEGILVKDIGKHIRSRRQATGGGNPTPHGDYSFGDLNRYASIYYSGNQSSVILVLTYTSQSNPTNTHVYRSTDYGATFAEINGTFGTPLWSNFHTSSASGLVVFYHSTQPTIYISENEGKTWRTQKLTPTTIDPRSFLWNPRNERSAIVHDPRNYVIYVTENVGQSWIKVSDNVAQPFDYQWGNSYDSDTSMIYYNSYDPNDRNRGDFTLSLYTQKHPYNAASRSEVDPNLGRHDGFLLLGPYIFAQRNDSNTIHLYISYLRQPFNLAKIPTTDPHQNYGVAHINELQALVVVQHESGKFNLYLSDITGVSFSLSLEDIIVTQNGIDLERIDGINGTMVANKNVVVNRTTNATRTVITLDNGAVWNYVTPPEVNLTGSPVLCEPPSCSLHFHMGTSEYARLGIYSQDSAPGIIIAHGNIGGQLADNPDLYISRDGGVSWYQTLAGSWGVTVVDHGGLLVAADDYHKESSKVLKYSCDEGISWRDYTYSNVKMTVYGVITEPGEATTTVSLYGVKDGVVAWDVVTVNFSSIFTRTCRSYDFYPWQPWDARSESDCILGLDVTLERRLPQSCCLIGLDYERLISTRVCDCSIDDYECDFGYMPAEGLNGPCVLDPLVPLQDPCADGQASTVMKSRGYRKIAGDVCTNGVVNYEPYQFTCCAANIKRLSQSNSIATGLGVAFAIAILIAAVLGVVVLFLACRRRSGGYSFTRMHFGGSGDDSAGLLNNDGGDDDDDPPLAL